MKLNNKGYLLVETIIATAIIGIIISAGMMLLLHSFKNWNLGESNFDINFNSRYSINKLVEEIRDSCGVEILDFSDMGWIKIYKTVDKNEFITFRAKNNKLFVGLNNILNSNSELANHIQKFKLEYLPIGTTIAENATGVNFELIFTKNDKSFSTNTSAAFRYK